MGLHAWIEGGLHTAEISSQDTFIDQGDVGMSTEPIDFTEDDGLGDDEEIEDIGVSSSPRGGRGGGRPRPQQRVVLEEPKTGAIAYIGLFLAAVVSICALLVLSSSDRGESNKITRWFAENLGGAKKEKVAGE